MSLKSKLTHTTPTTLFADFSDNQRLHESIPVAGVVVNTYALGQLEEVVVYDRGQIKTPLAVENPPKKHPKKTDQFGVLKGFRRCGVVKKLYDLYLQGKLSEYIFTTYAALFFKSDNQGLTTERTDADPEKIAAEIGKNLEHIPVQVYTDLTEAERTRLVQDKGEEKRIGKAETIQSVWKLFKSGFTEKDIIRQMYHQIADITGNRQKIEEVDKITDLKAKDKALSDWLHGTVGSFYLGVMKAGKRFQDALLRTSLVQDGQMPMREVQSPDGTATVKVPLHPPEFMLTHTRWNKLMKVRSDDEKTREWDDKKFTSKNFEKKIEEFKDEDSQGRKRGPGDSRRSADDLKNLAGSVFKDEPVAKAAFDMARGEKVENFEELVNENMRLQGIRDTIVRVIDHIAVPKDGKGKNAEAAKVYDGNQITSLLASFAHDNVTSFQATLAQFLNKAGIEMLDAAETPPPVQPGASEEPAVEEAEEAAA